jgi:hypothetical protein
MAACSTFGATRAHADPVATTATVLKVVDGDTIDIRADVRGRLRVRLLRIDTPETKKPGFTVRCCGPEASLFAKDTLLGQRVALIPDLTPTGTTDTGGHWPTSTRPMAGTTPSKPRGQVRRTRTCITAILLRAQTRSRRPNRKRRQRAVDFGDHRVSARRRQFRADEEGSR